MKKNLSVSLENAVSKSNIDLCASRVHMVLVAAFGNGNLDKAIEIVEGAISSIVDTITEDESK